MAGGGKGDWMMMEEAGARVVVLCTGSSGDRVGDSSAVVVGAKTVVGWGGGCGMVVKGLSARTCWDNLIGFGS